MTQYEMGMMYELMSKYQNEKNMQQTQNPYGVTVDNSVSPVKDITMNDIMKEIIGLKSHLSQISAMREQVQQAQQAQQAQQSQQAQQAQQSQQVQYDFEKAFNDLKQSLFMANINNMGNNTNPISTIDSVTADIIDPPLPEFGSERNGGRVSNGK